MNTWVKRDYVVRRSLVVVQSGRRLLDLYLPPETEPVLNPNVVNKTVAANDLTLDQVAWRDKRL